MQTDPRLVAVLGSPIVAGGAMYGNLRQDGNGGDRAELKITLSGSKGNAVLLANGAADDGAWKFDTLRVAVRGGETLDLAKAQ